MERIRRVFINKTLSVVCVCVYVVCVCGVCVCVLFG
jgi:hypothetical protein